MLPYPDMNFTAFDILTAEEMNQLVANIEALDLRGDYSTSEVNTGFKWVDGKDIYKKTINFGSLPNNAAKNVAHGITGVETWVLISGVTASGIPVNFANPASLASSVGCIVNSTNVQILTGADRTSDSAYITLWYTKV